MKANESSPHFDSKVRECSNFTVREIKKVCKEIGPRPSGGESERKAQNYIESLMGGIADSVKSEEFDVHPKAFTGWILIDGIGMLIASVLLILAHLDLVPFASEAFRAAAIVISVLAAVLFLGEFVFRKKVVDFLYPVSSSSNVICARNAAGELKRRIIFAGHIDSSYERRFLNLGGEKLNVTVVILGIGAWCLTVVTAGVSMFADEGVLSVVMTVIQALTIPIFIAVLFFENRKLCVMGANGGLTGVFSSMAVLKYLKDNGIRFENTEVIAVSTGCEECGQRGAQAFANAHAKDFAEDGAETVFIAVDALKGYESLSVFGKDTAGIAPLDKQAANLVRKAAEICGLDIPVTSGPLASTDASAAMKGGVKSAALSAVDRGAGYIHTRRDTADNIDIKTIETSLKIMLETAFLFDGQGLCDEY